MPQKKSVRRQKSAGQEPRPASVGLDIAALVLAVTGLVMVLLPYLGIFFSVAAIVCTLVRRRNAEKTRMSSVALVFGIIGTAANLLMLIILIVMIVPTITTDDGKGQDGASRYDTAVVIDAGSEKEGIDKEYAYLTLEGCPDEGGVADMTLQELQKKGEHIYDILHVRCKDGSSREYYFQIDSFFGKLGPDLTAPEAPPSEG